MDKACNVACDDSCISNVIYEYLLHCFFLNLILVRHAEGRAVISAIFKGKSFLALINVNEPTPWAIK